MAQEWLYDTDNIIDNLTNADISGVLVSVDAVSGNILFPALYFGVFALLVLGYTLASGRLGDGLLVSGFFMTAIGTSMVILGWLEVYFVFIAVAITVSGLFVKKLIDPDEKIVT